MPAFALPVVDDRHLDLVQDVGTGLPEGVVCLAPSGHGSLHARQLVVLEQANMNRVKRGISRIEQ